MALTGKNQQEIRTQVRQLIAANKWHEAIDGLLALHKKEPEVWIEKFATRLRVRGYKKLSDYQQLGQPVIPQKVWADPFPEVKNKIPEIAAKDLNVERLAGGVRHHGSLIVRNLISEQMADRLSSGIDKVMNHSDTFFKNIRKENNPGTRWFNPVSKNSLDDFGKGVKMMQKSGSMYALYSPRVSTDLIAVFERIQLKKMLEQYFEEQPCFSIKKWVLRKMTPLASPTDWHQDGAFMGKEIKSMNLWMALNDCGAGTDSPGMDFIPKRLHDIAPTGTEGAMFNWSVSRKYIADTFTDPMPERPSFKKGDAIFFDHMNLHCTSYSEDFKQQRYAIETWFFAQSSAPEKQLPAIW